LLSLLHSPFNLSLFYLKQQVSSCLWNGVRIEAWCTVWIRWLPFSCWRLISASVAVVSSRRGMMYEIRVVPVLNKHDDMQTYGGGGIAPRILNLITRWSWVISFTTQPSYPQVESHYPLPRRMFGSSGRPRSGGQREKNPFIASAGNRNPVFKPKPSHYTDRAIPPRLCVHFELMEIFMAFGAMRLAVVQCSD